MATDCLRALARGDLARFRSELGEVDGRLDLRGLTLPQPRIRDRRTAEPLFVQSTTDHLEIRGRRLESLDLSGSVLDGLRTFEVEIHNCRFDHARVHDWRMWATNLVDCTFEHADLRGSMLGAWHRDQPGRFERVSFRDADLRNIVASTPDFVDCDFSDARLASIDFQSSGFSRCRFAGELRDVVFWDRGFNNGKHEANPMRDVDFSKARFRSVEFRRLDLVDVVLPTDPDHLRIDRYPCVLEAALRNLGDATAPIARVVRAGLEHRQKWLGSDQQVGIVNRLDFRDLGSEVETLAIRSLRAGARECGSEITLAADSTGSNRP